MTKKRNSSFKKCSSAIKKNNIFQAKCLLDNPKPGDNSTSPKARCECREGYNGDAYTRCVPVLDENEFCPCDRLIFSTQNPLARDKHENSYGEYFLFDTFDGAPVCKFFKLFLRLYFNVTLIIIHIRMTFLKY